MLRIVVAALGLDAQDREAQVLARALRDAGHEVIFTGTRQTPEQVVATAVQEDADLIGLCIPHGAGPSPFRRVIELLDQRDAGDIVVFGRGTVSADDQPALAEIGVARIFPPAATTDEITQWAAEQLPGD
jgi:methylmalonyl-CoA mutase C-terminal domain/subunit